jgi:hypothetical protein
LRERTNPTPRLAQRATAAIDEEVNGRFAGKKSLGQRPEKRRVRHDRRRRNAPTSLTLREQACAGAQRRSRDENSTYSSSPGVTPERPNQARKPSPSQARSIPPRGDNIAVFRDVSRERTRTKFHSGTATTCPSTRRLVPQLSSLPAIRHRPPRSTFPLTCRQRRVERWCPGRRHQTRS